MSRDKEQTTKIHLGQFDSISFKIPVISHASTFISKPNLVVYIFTVRYQVQPQFQLAGPSYIRFAQPSSSATESHEDLMQGIIFYNNISHSCVGRKILLDWANLTKLLEKKDEFELNYSVKNPKCSFGSWDKGFSRIFLDTFGIFSYMSL